MCDTSENCPWICHVCSVTGAGESTACAACYKTTCAAHLRQIPIRNEQSGLYEFSPVCVYCATSTAFD